MSEQISTVAGDDFKEFVQDMLEYTFFKHNSALFKQCELQERKTKTAFEERFSDAVLLYHKLNLDVFAKSLLEREYGDDHLEYVWMYCERLLKDKYNHMGLIHYCAFILDLGIYFLFDDPDQVDLLIDSSFAIFEFYIKSHFDRCGGWDALYREADEYVAMFGNPQKTGDSVLTE